MIGGGPGMVDTRKEGRGGEGKLKRTKGMGMGGGRGIGGKVVISPGRFGGRREVR
jgi:hypothetical protein